MDFNNLSAKLISDLKSHKITDAQIAHKLGITRQGYAYRKNNNNLTSNDLTILSKWLKSVKNS